MYRLFPFDFCGLLVFLMTAPCLGNQIIPGCSITDESCEYFLSLGEYRMMTYLTRTSENTVVEEIATFHSNGSVSVKTHARCNQHRFISKEGKFKRPFRYTHSSVQMQCYSKHHSIHMGYPEA